MEQSREKLRAGSHKQPNANTNASASASKHTCELPQRKWKHKRQHKRWKIFHFLALAFALPFAFHMFELGQSKGKCKHSMENTHSMPLRFTFKLRWCPPLPSLISFLESLFLDCWSRVTRTLGTRLPSSCHTEMCVHIIPFVLACVCTCVAHVNQP